MSGSFFEQPVVNSPYEHPARHWELDPEGQPTSRIVEHRHSARPWEICWYQKTSW